MTNRERGTLLAYCVTFRLVSKRCSRDTRARSGPADEAEVRGNRGCFGARRGAKLSENLLEMILDRLYRDVKALGNILVCESSGNHYHPIAQI